MERLTRRSANGTGVYVTPSGEPVKWEDNYHNVLQKLAEYVDLEEQGKLIKLPCKVGDIVYKVNKASKKVSQHRVIKFEIEKEDLYYTMQIWFENYNFCFLNHFGETVFLTRSEAEQKLKEMESD